MDLERVFAFVAPSVRDAACQAAAQLERLGIRYALAGGLAVGAHGYVRATVDVDFLVGDEAFEHQGTLVTFKPGVPIQVGAIQIDYLSPAALGPHLEEAIEAPVRSQDLPVVSVEVLVYMKLAARRRKDLVDVVELLKAGADENAVRAYLTAHAADLLPSFQVLAEEAAAD
ncbi:MAG: hypothetical protein HY319_27380 [Armatimonadetes bacterium]|nr:hypothetical protein [Armatimonadota bacterium]